MMGRLGDQPRRLQVTAAFVLALALFAYLQPPQALVDPDSFYHARMVQLMRDHGLVRSFPWTQFTLYRTTFIDHHLGYHLALLPFGALAGDDLVGLKLATMLFASASVAAVAWCLARWRVPWWGFGVAVLLASAPFIFRLSLGKAPALAVGLAIMGFYLVVERKIGWLVPWSWLAVWTYSSWPLLVLFVGVVVLVDAASLLGAGFSAAAARLVSRGNLRLAGAVVLGLVLGLVINPYFPMNLVYLKQLFAMALIPYHEFIGIGSEWLPYSPFELPEYLAHGLLLWFLATVAGGLTFRRQSSTSRSAWLVTLIFIAYTLRARRQAEYLAPFLVISAGLTLRDAGLSTATVGHAWRTFLSWLPRFLSGRLVLGFLGLYLAVTLPLGLGRSVLSARAGLTQGFTRDSLSGVTGWLDRNAEPRSVVFQSDWGSFPVLFYHSLRPYYLTGLDQTFMYAFDPDRYRDWQAASRGERRDLYRIAKEEFGASYFLLEKRTPAALLWLNRDQRFRKAYEDSQAILYYLD